MKKFTVGDIVEVEQNGTLAYGIYTHEHSMYGSLIRFFEKRYGARPVSFEHFADEPVAFNCFLPLKHVKNPDPIKKVGHIELTEKLNQFPLFRTGLPDADTHRITKWKIWDGEKLWFVGDLSEKEKKYPVRGIWNLEYLLQRIRENWTDEQGF